MGHSPSFVLALGATVVAPAAARSSDDQSWTPAKQTDPSALAYEEQMARGSSPKPTDGPLHAVFGRIKLLPRLDEYGFDPQTCGFISSNGYALSCSTSRICTYQSDFVGCCKPNVNCQYIVTKCFDYRSPSAAACQDDQTLCCDISSPACYTYTMTRSSPGAKTNIYTVLGCSTTPGTGVLLDYDPRNGIKSSPSTTTAAPVTSTSASTSTIPPDGGSSSPNIGAIVGGVVGGVAALALIGLGIFLFLRKKKKSKGSNSSTSSPPTDMTQAHQAQQPIAQKSFTANQEPPPPAQGYNHPQSAYDPRMSMYSSQAGYNAHSSQQQGFNSPSNTASYPSPPPHISPSPHVSEVDKKAASPYVTTAAVVQPSEMPIQYPVGNEHNRAELGR